MKMIKHPMMSINALTKRVNDALELSRRAGRRRPVEILVWIDRKDGLFRYRLDSGLQPSALTAARATVHPDADAQGAKPAVYEAVLGLGTNYPILAAY